MDKENVMRIQDFQGASHAEENKENSSPQSSSTALLKRPPFSYIALITMALKQAPDKMSTLREIYNFIENRFPYYTHLKTKWKNSIRHNLSLNDCFVNIKRNQGQSGRGHYWKMKEGSKDMFKHGTFRRRKERSIKGRTKPVRATTKDPLPQVVSSENVITRNNTTPSQSPQILPLAASAEQQHVVPTAVVDRNLFSIKYILEKPHPSGSTISWSCPNSGNTQASVNSNSNITSDYYCLDNSTISHCPNGKIFRPF